jgi:gamma-glutamyltranspeptidase/glutathione hydrolase
MRQGGNAFDAAIAAVMTAWVTESVLTSAGGGGFLLAHTAQGHNCLFDFFTQTPGSHQTSHPADFYPINANFGDTVQEFHIGLGSIAVPGMVAGLWHIHERLGRLSMAAIAEPAIQHARQGVTVNPFLAYVYEILEPILRATPLAKSLYTHDERLLMAGDVLKMPRLADTLSHLVQTGPAAFYEGSIAQRLVNDCQATGGYLTLADLQRYQVIERSPLALPYRDTTFLTNPPPSSGGALIGFALKLLEAADVRQFAHGSPEYVQCLVQAMSLTNEARRDGYDQYLYHPDVVANFLAAEQLYPYQQKVARIANKLGSTTHISTIDAEGNAASVTTSNGEGSSYVIPETDIMLNNMLGEEDLHPQGFHQWLPNRRISSMMAPTMILKDDKPQLVLGSGGSNRIRTAILQVIANVLDFEMSLEAAIAAPRIHWERGLLNVEPGYQAEAMQAGVSLEPSELLAWQGQNMFFGGVHAVAKDVAGEMSGAGDTRRGGAVEFV